MLQRASSGGLPLLAAALSVSLDELAVGFSFGVLRLPVAPALVVIALQAFCISLFGLWLGRRVGAAVGERAELLAGVMLCLLGVALAVARLAGLADL
jgi:putative Mn2+ efflux pump MntP